MPFGVNPYDAILQANSARCGFTKESCPFVSSEEFTAPVMQEPTLVEEAVLQLMDEGVDIIIAQDNRAAEFRGLVDQCEVNATARIKMLIGDAYEATRDVFAAARARFMVIAQSMHAVMDQVSPPMAQRMLEYFIATDFIIEMILKSVEESRKRVIGILKLPYCLPPPSLPQDPLVPQPLPVVPVRTEPTAKEKLRQKLREKRRK